MEICEEISFPSDLKVLLLQSTKKRDSIMLFAISSLLQTRFGIDIQARSILYAYTHVRTWSDQKILKILAIVSIFNILLVHNQDFAMKTPLWLNSKH